MSKVTLNLSDGQTVSLSDSATVKLDVTKSGKCNLDVKFQAITNLQTPIKGISYGNCNIINSNDSLIIAMGKLQCQITNIVNNCCNDFVIMVHQDNSQVITVDNTDVQNPIINFNGVFTDGTTISGNGTFGNPLVAIGGGAGGTVTSVSANDLNPLFTTSVATPNTTPVISFVQISQNQNLVFASPDGAAGNPIFRSLVVADISNPADIISSDSSINIGGAPLGVGTVLKGVDLTANIFRPDTEIFFGTGTGYLSNPNFTYNDHLDNGGFISTKLLMNDPNTGNAALLIQTDDGFHGNAQFSMIADNLATTGNYATLICDIGGAFDLNTYNTGINHARLIVAPYAFNSAAPYGIFIEIDASSKAAFTAESLRLHPISNNDYAIRWYERGGAGGLNFVGFQNPPTIASDVTWILPNTDSTGTQALVSDGAGNMSWATMAAGFALTNGSGTTANGTAVDLGGTLTSNVQILGASLYQFNLSGITSASITSGDALYCTTTSDLQILAVLGDVKITGVNLRLLQAADKMFIPNLAVNNSQTEILVWNSADGKVQYRDVSSLPFGTGTVTSVSVVTANGISGSVATSTTTPAITLTLGAITPTSVNGITFSGSGSIANTGVSSLTAFTGSGTSSGTNTGDQTIASLSPLTTKGDIFVFSTVNTRLAVAVGDGKILQVSSGAATGLAWSTPTYPSASGTAGKVLRSDGTNNVYSTFTIPDTYTTGDIIYASAANVFSALADVAVGSYLRSGGVTTAPLWSTLILPNSATSTRVVVATSANTYGESANLTFSTATLKIGVATSALGVLQLTGNTSGTVSINTAAAAGTWTLQLPTTGGTVNYFLQTDGTGITTWAAGGSSSLVVGTTAITSGTGTRLLYETSGNVLGEVSGATADGTSVTFGSANLLATSPKITTQISDVNGNAMITFSATAGAVDTFTITNAATANPATVKFQATGSDSNINALFSPKGTGTLKLSDGTDLTKLFSFNLSGMTTAITLTISSSQTTSQTLTIPNLAGARTVAVVEANNSFSALQTFTTGAAISFNQQLGVGTSAANIVYRTTNGGADVTPTIVVGTNSVSAGQLNIAFDQTNQLTFDVTNGTRRIARAALQVVNLTNTAGSEAGDLAIYTQSAGAAMTEKFRAKAAGGITMASYTTATSFTGTPIAMLSTNSSGDIIQLAHTVGRATAQTAANASVATYTLTATDGSFLVAANVLVTTSSAENFTVTVSYTDEGNTARTLTLNFQTIAGVIGTAIAFANGAVPYEGVAVHLRCKASTAITIKAATGTYTGCTFNIEGLITQIS